MRNLLILLSAFAASSQSQSYFFDAPHPFEASEICPVNTGCTRTANLLRTRPFLNGIAGYDLLSERDEIVPIRLNLNDGTGRMADLLIYRPGSGIVWILRLTTQVGPERYYNNRPAADWTAIAKYWSGMNGVNMMDVNDRIVPLDFNNDGRTDLLLFSPKSGFGKIVKGNSGTFEDVPFNTTNRFYGYNLNDVNDQIIPAYIDNNTSQDLLIYNPVKHTAATLISNQDGSFTNPTSSAGNLLLELLLKSADFSSASTKVIAARFTNDACADIFLYNPESGKNTTLVGDCAGNFRQPYATQDKINGIVLNNQDDVVTTDVNNDKLEDLVIYRKGLPIFSIQQSAGNGLFSQVYSNTKASVDDLGVGPFPRMTESFSPALSPAGRCVSARFNFTISGGLYCYHPSQRAAGMAYFYTATQSKFTRAWMSGYQFMYENNNPSNSPHSPGCGLGCDYSQGQNYIRTDARVVRVQNRVVVLRSAVGTRRDAILHWTPGSGKASVSWLVETGNPFTDATQVGEGVPRI